MSLELIKYHSLLPGLYCIGGWLSEQLLFQAWTQPCEWDLLVVECPGASVMVVSGACLRWRLPAEMPRT